ncbi:hypothetical protein [Erwinia aphidicola]
MKIFGIRILAVLMTWGVQVAIVLLQVWCRQCVFGNEQRKALESAIREVL